MSEQPPEGGHEGGGHKGMALHLPVWGWALIIGAGAGLIYFVRKRQASAASSTTDTSATDTTPQQDIIPVDEGGDDKADADLLAAIQKLQGPPSTPKPPIGGGNPPTGGKPVPVPTPPKKKPPAKKPTGPSSHFVSIDSYEDLVEVARSYGHTATELWTYQLEKGVRPAKTQAELKQRGIRNAFREGSSVAVPTSWKKK